MKKYLLILLLSFACYSTQAQIINNKVNIYFGYISGAYSGEKILNLDNYISPALFPNFHAVNGLSIKGLVKYNKFLSIGLGFDYSIANKWSSDEHTDFDNSIATNYTFSPTVQFHSPYKESGIFNRLTVMFELAPTVGSSKFELQNSLFEIQSDNEQVTVPMNSKDFLFGIKTGAGFELAINNRLGVYFNYSFQTNWISSILYADTNMLNSNLAFGLKIKLIKDKYYFYGYDLK